jgi:hypothetical protein
MINKTELINYAVEHNLITYNKDTDEVTFINSDTTTSADKFIDAYRKVSGQSFECIYDEHCSCFSILKCTECGTYIFEHYDEDYELNLKCPICTDYKTGFKYYTMLNILEDDNKRKEIDMYLEFARIQKEADERYIKRGNLYDWEKTHKKTIFKGKNKMIDIQFTGHGKWDLEVRINVWKKEDMGYVHIYEIKIPLSPSAFYIQFIYKHLGKCHKDLRSKFYIGKTRENN